MGLCILLLGLLCACKKTKEPVEGKTLADVNVSAYDKWVYLSFASGTPIEKGLDEAAPAEWDIAMHRENIKTNEGAAMQSNAGALSELTALPAGTFTADVMTDSVVIADMSQMMQGIIVYQKSMVNMVLNAWVSRAGMPPVYTVNDNVYVVRNKEGKYAKIKFSSYKNAEDKTGFATFSYEYPAFQE